MLQILLSAILQLGLQSFLAIYLEVMNFDFCGVLGILYFPLEKTPSTR